MHAKLIGVAGPMRRGVKGAKRNARWLGHVSVELMMDRIHQILADTPRVIGLHVGRRWNHDGDRGAPIGVGVIAVPWSRCGKVHRVNVRVPIDINSRSRLAMQCNATERYDD